MEKLEKAYFPALTGVRAMAAYMVFVHHFIPFQIEIQYFNLGYFFGEFHIGVTFFFVLSGFLIHHRYGNFRELNLNSYWKYFASRIARIIPIFFILSTLTFIFNYFFHTADQGFFLKNFGLWLLNISLIKGFFSGLKFSGISQAWSLTVEFCFYAAAPILFTQIKNVKKYPIISFGLLAIGFGLVLVFSQLPLHGFFGDNDFMLSYSFFGRSFEFFAGCYLSFQFKNWSKQKHLSGWFTYFSLCAILTLLYSLSMVRLPTTYGVHTIPGLFINNLLLPIAIVFFFRGLLFENTVLSRIFSSPTGQLLGKSSYAFYLIHVGFIEIGIEHFITRNSLIIFLLTNIISIGIYLWMEEPLNQLVKRKLWKINLSGENEST